MTDWAFAHRVWEKWASNNVGSSGEKLRASEMPCCYLYVDKQERAEQLQNLQIIYAGRAEQHGIKAKPVELGPFIDFIKRNNLQGECFFIGQNQYMITSIHENWFCARCVNTQKPAGEGVIVMQTTAFLLVALYDGSIGSASRAMVVIDQFAWQLGRKNL
ncbi:PREDICTED: uncharacterized protein LOC104591564 isoform X1 [Nelumbo nucifera]|uniref:Uncharacterized protein LOC104591564 isoform X1 n=1 Tax=Nelumbo nucifera TaxID=4432 RepID=A0A1U7Z635_NELNU|nr:PREDICTED: uncharacterized protein LOC104591564 isoform X1 [Nelumbo nucifera]